MHIFMSLQKVCYTINRNVHSVCRATGLALERAANIFGLLVCTNLFLGKPKVGFDSLSS